MQTIQTSRPRNVNTLRAAAILYGDLGTSKAYVLGITFALAAYSSFWFILAVSVLTLVVGLNYITICQLYPNGGGVYASVRSRSEVLALVGAFFLISDYLVTAALSALSAFHYLDVPHPELAAIIAIGVVGVLNFFGPKHTGSLAMMLALPTVLVVVCLAAISVPFLPHAVSQLAPLPHSFSTSWVIFVGIIVALSGIESIANTTGSMQLDPGSTEENPSVGKTSKKAILIVILEVCVFTTVLGLAMNALPGLVISGEEVSAPGFPDVRDAILRYMGETFGAHWFGVEAGYYLGVLISIVIALLLFSAVNTAIVALISLLFVMSSDQEIPGIFQRLNRFGVPFYAAIAAFIIPMALLLFVHDIVSLANLYAIGFVGAITVNLGATSTNYKLNIAPLKRYFMMATFVVMALIEVTLFVQKPHARIFVVTVMAVGLLLRMIMAERKERAVVQQPVGLASVVSVPAPIPVSPIHSADIEHGILVVVSDMDKSLDFAMEEAKIHNYPLNVLFVRERKVMPGYTRKPDWTNDQKARKVYDYIHQKFEDKSIGLLYTMTANPAHSIAEIAKLKKVQQVILGRQRGNYLVHFFKGNTIRDLGRELPKNVDLIVVS